jgi:hypothetical protein
MNITAYDGQNVSITPSNISIGLSKYPTRNITAVHVIPCPPPEDWYFLLKYVFFACLAIIAFGLLSTALIEQDTAMMIAGIPAFIILYGGGYVIYKLYWRPQFNALTFGNATDQPVLITLAFTFGEYLSFLWAGDKAKFPVAQVYQYRA